MSSDNADDHRPTPPALMLPQAPAAPSSSLSDQLLLQALNDLSVIGRQIERTEAQNEAIIESIAKADRRQDAADESRGKIHTRINEMSVNLASVESEVDGLKALTPIVNMLKDANLERKTIRRVIKDLCKNGYVITGAVATTGGAVWHQWENFKFVLARLIGAKLGGP